MNLLILTSQGDEAQGFIRSLRNGGLPVRGTFLKDLDQLEELVTDQTFDIILCCEYDPAIDLDLCMSRYQEIGVDLPLVVIAGDETDAAVLTHALQSGARDRVSRRSPDHLQLVVAREIGDLENRRDLERLRDRLEECEQRAKGTIDASGEAVAFLQEGVHVQVNPAYHKLFGFESADDMDGYPLLDLVRPEHQSEAKQILKGLGSLGAKETKSLDLKCVRADGGPLDVELSVARTVLDGEPCLRVTAKVPRRVGGGGGGSVFLDPETGFATRSGLLTELSLALDPENPGSTPVAALYVQVNGYAELAQAHGLSQALAAAAKFASALRERVPDGAFLGRLTDNGFVVVLKDQPRTVVMELAGKLKDQTILAFRSRSGDETRLGCATGIAVADPGADTAEGVIDTLFRDYALRALGTSSPAAAPPAAPAAAAARPAAGAPDKKVASAAQLGEKDKRYVALLDEAFRGEGFRLVYQPIVSLKGDSNENYSALLRLRQPDGKLIEAKDFLPAAEHTGRMLAVDRWVIQHAIAEVANRRGQHQKINLFVNLSEEALQDEGTLLFICDCLRESKARGNWLTFKIQEDHARRQGALYGKLREGLKQVKCRVALTRFGTGPDPAVVLSNLGADYVKLAPELGNGLADDARKQKQLMDLAALARDAQVRTVVTGVEDARSLTVLWTAGVDYVQGNFLQKPSPNIEVKEEAD